jgi:hypothetical protein
VSARRAERPSGLPACRLRRNRLCDLLKPFRAIPETVDPQSPDGFSLAPERFTETAEIVSPSG